MAFGARAHVGNPTHTEYVTAACASIAAALAAKNANERYRNLNNAVDDLAAAREMHLAARVRDINLHHAGLDDAGENALLVTFHNGLARQYGLTLDIEL